MGLGKSLGVRSVNPEYRSQMFKGWRTRGPRDSSIVSLKGINNVGYQQCGVSELDGGDRTMLGAYYKKYESF